MDTPAPPSPPALLPPPQSSSFPPAPPLLWQGSITVALGPGLPESRALAALARLRRAWGSHGIRLTRSRPGSPADLRLQWGRALNGEEHEDSESYRLEIGEAGVLISGAGPRGLVHGCATLAQLATPLPLDEGSGEAPNPVCPSPGIQLPIGRVEDHPHFPHRGVMIDVSRDKVPTLPTLLRRIDRLASWKINQIQLYFEHVFAYQGHETVWREASPFTPAQVRALDLFCRHRGIELVPNQNSFGHFHRWLRHDEYRPLAECPEGVEHPFSDEIEPFSLCPTDPETFQLLGDLYSQLLPCFSSDQLNVGCDETFDMVRCRSQEAAEERSSHAVYLDTVNTIANLAHQHGRRIQLWGDILLKHPEAAHQLPEDSVILEWGYEADHPFHQHVPKFAAACQPPSRRQLYVCPGTSSWNSFGGRWQNALDNLAAAAQAGAEHGAHGLLITDWGDYGHLQPPVISLPGLVAGACRAWCPDGLNQPGAPSVENLLDRHALLDPSGTLSTALRELGSAFTEIGGRAFNGTPLFHLIIHPDDGLDHRRYQGLSAEGLQRCKERLLAAATSLSQTRSQRPDAQLLARELTWVAELLTFACDLALGRLQAAGGGSAGALDDLPKDLAGQLAEALSPLVAEHRPLWLARHRPGGRRDSVHRLERLLGRLQQLANA
ncbi:MAG: family 20 glycosylhydrolase [Acidobacteriota bacterium]